MVLYPDILAKAQAEIDRVVGMDRFPEFNDQENLPYVTAVCKEVRLNIAPAFHLFTISYDRRYVGDQGFLLVRVHSRATSPHIYGARAEYTCPSRYAPCHEG